MTEPHCDHNFIRITSSTRLKETPYLFCSRCGEDRSIPMTNPEVAAVAERLSPAMKEALATLPLPRDANPVYMIAARPYGSLWRKSAKHWTAMRALEEKSLVERTVSRGETLWRLTRPVGLAVRSYLLSQEAGEGK